MRRSLILGFGVSAVLASPALATTDMGTTTVLESTARGTLVTSKTARLRFALPAGRWTQDRNDDGTPSPGVYTRSSSIGGHSCTVSVFVSGRGQNRRPTLTPRRHRGRIPFAEARRGIDGAHRWFTARSTGTPGPAAPAPYGAAYRRAPSGSPWKYARIDAEIGFLEPATSACHRSGARVNLRPLVTSFHVATPERLSGPSCTTGKTVVRTGAVRVFELRYQVFSCYRRERRRLVIRELYYDRYSVPAVAGRWLAYGAEHSDQNDYSTQVSLFDLRSGRKTPISANGRVVALVLKDNGSLAFVSRVEPGRDDVIVADKDGFRTVSTGPTVSKGSLRRARGGTVRWSTAGGTKSARLR